MAHKGSLAKRLISTASQIRAYSAPADRSIPPAKQKYVPTSGTYPKGFLAGSAFAGVKASNTKYDDLALIVSEKPCAAGAVFTQNIFKAAPVSASQRILTNRNGDGIRGVVVNSGCANAVTGQTGRENADTMARVTDRCFAPNGIPNQDADPQTIVMSTGVIGQQLPIDRITAAIPKLHGSLGSAHEHWLGAAQAICTTDTFPKLLSRTFTLPSHPDTEYTIAGMTKGAGMIHPNMATLLGIVCTDVNISPTAIKGFLRECTNRSFNCISIDGDTSTNDTIALLANGAAAPASTAPLAMPASDASTTEVNNDALAFRTILGEFMTDLAKLVVRDGEGATKFVTIRVHSDCGYKTAKRVASSIAQSSLVKTALYGKDANWGRILCAIGYAPGIMHTDEIEAADSAGREQVVPAHTSVTFVPADGSAELKLLVRGEPQEVDEVRAKEILEMEDLEILVRLDDGSDISGSASKPSTEAVVWTCDLSHEYVTINGDYRT